MPEINKQLQHHQESILKKFKEDVSDITLPHHDDKYLLRWLKARSWNLKAAEEMFRKSMKWRQIWEVDGALKTWECPDVLLQYYPYGTTGFDKDGAPICVIPYSGLDIVGIICSVGGQAYIKKTIQEIEKNLNLSVEKGDGQIVVLGDMENFALRPYLWRPAMNTIITILKIYEANYPELLKVCYVINAPAAFVVGYNIIKKFLSENTINKIRIYKNDPNKWKPDILKHIDPGNIPAHYGGTLKDPDGNPKYLTVVKPGGKIPEHFYRKNPNYDARNNKYKQATVKKGGKLNLDYRVVQEGCLLRWDFCTENHDIGFAVTHLDADGNTRVVIENKRISANEDPETGVLECQALSTYTVTFDNSYSYLRSKMLHYDIVVTESVVAECVTSPE